MDCDVERANAVGDELLHHQPLDGRHHQRHLQRHPQLHIHAHRQLAFWWVFMASKFSKENKCVYTRSGPQGYPIHARYTTLFSIPGPIWYSFENHLVSGHLKYRVLPLISEIPDRIFLFLVNPNLPATQLFCSLPDLNPPIIEKTLPVGPCFSWVEVDWWDFFVSF